MNDYKEFQGKTLDAAIQEACSHFGEPREKLEIEIVSDAKGGIFGLVGARKATIRARRVAFESVIDSLSQGAKSRQAKPAKTPPPRGHGEAKPAPAARGEETAALSARIQPAPPSGGDPMHQEKRKKTVPHPMAPVSAGEPRDREPADTAESVDTAFSPRSKGRTVVPPRAGKSRPRAAADRRENEERPPTDFPRKPLAKSNDDDDGGVDDLPRRPLSELDGQVIIGVAAEAVQKLVTPLLGNAVCGVRITDNTIHVTVTSDDDPGLLIGRDGQTLASVQYLATRIISNTLQCLARVHVDAGEYRQRQDERLRDLALALAEKVRNGGRTQMTRPLSSYQRRIVHLTLQDDETVQTHSKGEGEMKRVIIAMRRQGSDHGGRHSGPARTEAGEN